MIAKRYGWTALVILLLMFGTVQMNARRCGGCGGRARSGGRPRSGGRSSSGSNGFSSRSRSHSHSGHRSGSSDNTRPLNPTEKSFGLGILSFIFGIFSFAKWREFLGLHDYHPKKCTIPLKDHVLNWWERLALLCLACLPIMALMIILQLNPAGIIGCVIAVIIYLLYDHLRA